MKICCSVRNFQLAALLLSIFLTGGCDNGQGAEPAPRDKPVIGVLLYREEDPYILLVRQALLQALNGKAETIIFHARGDQLTQNEHLDELLRRNVDGLALNLVDIQTASSVLNTLKKSDIPVVLFNREPNLNSVRLYSKAAFVGTDITEAGILQGDIIARLWKEHPEFDRNRDGEFQFIMFQGNADNPEAIGRTEYSVRQARERGVPMRQIGQNYIANWDGDEAAEAMRLALIGHPNTIELVVANSDSMALGAIKALQESGFNLPGGSRDKFIPVIGVDAIPQAITAINEGSMSATVKQDSEAMAQAVSALLMNAVAGRDFLEGTSYQWGESGVAVRIPYSPVIHKD